MMECVPFGYVLHTDMYFVEAAAVHTDWQKYAIHNGSILEIKTWDSQSKYFRLRSGFKLSRLQ